MTTVQDVKSKIAAREPDALLKAIAPEMARRAQRRREEEARKAEAIRRHQAAEACKRHINQALARAGIPLRVL